MVMAATVGSLVHPPGFPLFCQLNDWLIGTIGGSPYHLIATASVVEHALAALLFFWVFSFWLKSVWLSGSLTLCMMLSPSAIKIATDAEVFAFHHLLMAIVVCVALSVYRKPTLYKMMGFGLVFGLAGTHHPLALFWLPLAMLPFVKERKDVPKRAFAFILFALIGLSPYFLLFERYEAAPFWAFGHVTTFSELYHHAMRTTYGTLKLSGDFSGAVTSLVIPFLIEAIKSVPLLVVLFCFGLFNSYREKNTSRLILCFVFIFHFIFLLLAQTPETEVALELMSRFYSSLLLALMLAALPGCFYFLESKSRMRAFLVVVGLLAPTVLNLPQALERSQWTNDRVTRDFLDATFQALPENSIFVAQHDAEAFGMLHDQAVAGIRKDVQIIVEGRLSTVWYREQLKKKE